MMKRFAALALSLSLLVAGCGGGQDGTDIAQRERSDSAAASTPNTLLTSNDATASLLDQWYEKASAVAEAWANGINKPYLIRSPIRPVPRDLWQPPEGATPATGSYVFLQSDAGDSIGQGQTRLFTPANAVLTAWHRNSISSLPVEAGAYVGVLVQGDESWEGDFQGMESLFTMKPALFDRLSLYGRHSLYRGGMGWKKPGQTCRDIQGWFFVDSVTWTANQELASVELRFEQHCNGEGAALRGKVRWSREDAASTNGRFDTVPAGLWRAPDAVRPASGNYLYLESEPFETGGAGNTYLLNLYNASLNWSGNAYQVGLSVTERLRSTWTLSVGTNKDDVKLAKGFYPGAEGSRVFDIPAFRLYLDNQASRCTTSDSNGWVAIDEIRYVGNEVAAIAMRFERFCSGHGVSVKGEFRGERYVEPPYEPLPTGQWTPSAGTVPETGNYVYLESEPKEPFAKGQSELFTPQNATMSVTLDGAYLTVLIDGVNDWRGYLYPPKTFSTLQPGLYTDLPPGHYHSSETGGLQWFRNGVDQYITHGWMAVDNVNVVGGQLQSLDLRFEMYSGIGMSLPPLRGKIHWGK